MTQCDHIKCDSETIIIIGSTELSGMQTKFLSLIFPAPLAPPAPPAPYIYYSILYSILLRWYPPIDFSKNAIFVENAKTYLSYAQFNFWANASDQKSSLFVVVKIFKFVWSVVWPKIVWKYNFINFELKYLENDFFATFFCTIFLENKRKIRRRIFTQKYDFRINFLKNTAVLEIFAFWSWCGKNIWTFYDFKPQYLRTQNLTAA